MTIVLNGKDIAKQLQEDILYKRHQYRPDQKIYMAIIFLGSHSSSQTYVTVKQNFGRKIDIPVEIFGQENNQSTLFPHLHNRQHSNYHEPDSIIQLIEFLNQDKACKGIIIQLPLPTSLQEEQSQIMQYIAPSKDIDALAGVVYWLDSLDMIDFLGATPQAARTLLQAYNLDQLKSKTVTILGQSNLSGKALTTHCIKQGATVISCNKNTNPQDMKNYCKQADYIFSCTGHIHLIDEEYIRHDQSQIILDIGYGHLDGKPVGDVDIQAIADKVYAYTPVPGGIGPLTVACLFDNICKLHDIFGT